MGNPMTLAQMESQFKKFKVQYKIVGDPTKWRRDPAHGAFGPVNGCGIHHTGDDAPDTADEKVIHNGRSDLPGPLAQFGCPDNGVLQIHSIGRANHFGGGDPDVLKAVQNESYGDYPPHTDKHEGEAGAVDGNTHFYGWETYYSGLHKMTDAAYKTLVLSTAAICDFYGWSEKSVIGHKEWSDYKVDPGFCDMKQFRADVKLALAGKATEVKKPPRPTVLLTAALAENVKYRKSLEAVTNKGAQTVVKKAIVDAKAQYRALVEFERK